MRGSGCHCVWNGDKGNGRCMKRILSLPAGCKHRRGELDIKVEGRGGKRRIIIMIIIIGRSDNMDMVRLKYDYEFIPISHHLPLHYNLMGRESFSTLDLFLYHGSRRRDAVSKRTCKV